MKRALATLALALIVGVLAFTVCYHLATRPVRQMAEQDETGIAWLAHEFRLSSEQTSRVQELHDRYEVHCREMCRRIEETNARLGRMISKRREMTPEMEAAFRESVELQSACRREMLAYIYAVAALMPDEQRDRYLDLMKPRVLAPGMPHVSAYSPDHPYP